MSLKFVDPPQFKRTQRMLRRKPNGYWAHVVRELHTRPGRFAFLESADCSETAWEFARSARRAMGREQLPGRISVKSVRIADGEVDVYMKWLPARNRVVDIRGRTGDATQKQGTAGANTSVSPQTL